MGANGKCCDEGPGCAFSNLLPIAIDRVSSGLTHFIASLTLDELRKKRLLYLGCKVDLT